ncbi:nucleotidyl transferase AbiEii/AbiGii toxin family protein [Actinokineospora sp. 24-640]
MSKPTKKTASGRAYLELQNRARRETYSTDELITLYVLERWLARLAASPYQDSFVLKGGLLLAVFNARRPTSDVDLLAQNLTNEQDAIADRVHAITQVSLDQDDGVLYLPDTLAMQTIREDAQYTGVRVTMDCQVSPARARLKLDINVGDPVTPAPEVIRLPSQRPDLPDVQLLGYPIESVLAEKTSTAIELGEANTRVRDYVDIYTLTGKQSMTFATARAALEATTNHRGVRIRPLSEEVGTFAALRQGEYDKFRRRLGPGSGLPESLADVVAGVVRFADPLVGSMPPGVGWEPAAREWR